VINEIMPAPSAPEPEWVELYNYGSDTVFLQSMYLYDATSRAPIPDLVIPPETFVVLCKDTLALRAARSLPYSVHLCRISLPSLNNSGETLRLTSKDSITIDSIVYSISWGKAGVSLERIDARLPLHSRDNCRESSSWSGATCGMDNSVSPRNGDAAITAIGVDTAGRRLSIRVRNMGNTSLPEVRVELGLEKTTLPGVTLREMFAFEERLLYYHLDSLVRIVPQRGWCAVRAHVVVNADTRPWNDSLNGVVYLTPARGSLLFNEILYDPVSLLFNDEVEEFVELFNADTIPLSVEGLQIRAGDDVCSLGTITMLPASFLAVVADSSFAAKRSSGGSFYTYTKRPFSLRSTWDSILITDPYGYVIDSLCYTSEWQSPHIGSAKGRSLEKRAPRLPSALQSAWTSCVDSSGSTAARANSTAVEINGSSRCSASPNPFSPSSTRGDRQSSVISLRAPFAQAVWSVRVFDVQGHEMMTLLNGVFMNGEAYTMWDGRSSNGDPLQAGPYILFCEAVDAYSGETFAESIVVVIGS
jgi:hypothetical protein